MSPYDYTIYPSSVTTRPTHLRRSRSTNTIGGGGNVSISTTNTTSSTNSSTTPVFPRLTSSQYTRLDRIINSLDQTAKTWNEFKTVKDQLEQSRLSDQDDDDEEEDLYGISLKLVLQDGTTWKEKWNKVVQQQQQPQSVGSLDILRAKMDKLTTTTTPKNLNRPQSTPPPFSRILPKLPHPPPSIEHTPTTTTPTTTLKNNDILPRNFLVQRQRRRNSASSSSTTDDDQYVGVPSLQDLALARRKERLRRQQVKGGTDLDKEEEEKQSTKHPLLERRLQELGLPPPPSPTPTPTKEELMESKAKEFRNLHLISTHFDQWLNLIKFFKSRLESVELARDQWLLRCNLLDWNSFTRKKMVLKTLIQEEWFTLERQEKRDLMIKKEWFCKWKELVQRREKIRFEERVRELKEKREKELKQARNLVIKRGKEILLKTSLQKWRLKTLELLAFKFRLRYLPLHPLRRWFKQLAARLDHVETLKGVAEEVFNQKVIEMGEKTLRVWLGKTRLKIQEREYWYSWKDRTKRDVIERWKTKTRDKIHEKELENFSIITHNKSLVEISLSNWKSKILNLSKLSSIATQTSNFKLLSNSLKIWRLKLKASKHFKENSKKLGSKFLIKWLENLDFIELDLNQTLFETFSSKKNSSLVLNCFNQWKSRFQHLKQFSLQQAVKVDKFRTVQNSLSNWKTRFKKIELENEKSKLVYEFFKQRDSFKKWRESFQKRKRNKWEFEQKRKRKLEVLEFWIKRTKQSREDKKLIEIVSQKNRKNTLENSLTDWKDQVIIRKELERESTILYESRLVHLSFKNWILKTINHSDQLNRADSFRCLKLEELRDHCFQKWFQSTKRSINLKQKFSDFEIEKRKQSLENCFGIWREKRLRGFEIEVENRIEKGTKGNVLKKWVGESKTLTALRSYRKNLIRKSFNHWKRWTPSTELLAQAVQHDSQSLIRCGVQRWSLKTSYRQAYRNTSGRLGAPRTSPFPSPVSPTSSSSSLSLVRKRSSITSFSPSPTLDSPSPFSNHGSRSVVPTTTTTTTTPSSISISFLTPRNLGDGGNPRSGFGHRPRLSAEYKAPLRAGGGGRSRTPPRRTRRDSVISLETTRSAPARVVESFDHDTQEEEGGGIARSEGGGRRRVEREQEEEEGVRKRDVRKGYEALRERLRAAR